MSLPVSLQDIVNGLEAAGDLMTSYLNRATGEVWTLAYDELAAAENAVDTTREAALPEWEREARAKARESATSEDWLPLPTKRDIHEYAIMEAFCTSVSPAGLRDALLDAIRGSGAFKRFKASIRRLGIEDDWHRHRNEELTEIARRWLRQEEIAWRE